MLADDFLARGDEASALKSLQGAHESHKGHVAVAERLAWLHARAGRAEQAVEAFRALCAHGACTARVRGNLVWAQSHFHLKPGVAERYIAEADADLENVARQFETGVLLHYNRRYAESQPYLDRALKRWPDGPRVLLYSAMNLYRSGRQEEAQRAIDDAMERASKRDPDLDYCRGIIYRNVDLKSARADLQRYLDATRGGAVPEAKRRMVEDMVAAMDEELKRRAGGASPRPFADPERANFGEPPNSPGAAADAIIVSKSVMGLVGAGPSPQAGGGTPPPEPGGSPLWMILAAAGVGLLVTAGMLARRGRAS